MEKLSNYINGEWVAPANEAYLTQINPATREPLYQVPLSTVADVDQAVEAAEAAYPAWRALTSQQRAHYLYAMAEQLQQQITPFAQWESMDNGKPLSQTESIDIPRSIHNLRFFAEAINQWSSESHQGQGSLNYTTRQPRGVAACISPWNLPLYLLTWKIAPALVTGNTVVAKPSEITPYTAYQFSTVAHQVGLPPGVLNIIHGTGQSCGESLVTHPKVSSVTFTGGTATGQRIATQIAPQFKKYSLELGGKNPQLVFADCNITETVTETIRAAFTNQGQICLCSSRILVEASIYEAFKSELVTRTAQLVVGDPLLEETQQGAVVSEAHYHKILAAIEHAQQEGGNILTGGHSLHPKGRCQHGFFIAPTIIEGVAPDSDTCQQEIFGPVITLTPFSSTEEAVTLANQTAYGLSASIWTNHLQRAHAVADALDAGIVWINSWLLRDLRTPFGGMKQSGMGREGGHEALRFFTEPKNICMPMPNLMDSRSG